MSPPAPESAVQFVKCNCEKSKCDNRCSCEINSVECIELCRCEADTGEWDNKMEICADSEWDSEGDEDEAFHVE